MAFIWVAPDNMRIALASGPEVVVSTFNRLGESAFKIFQHNAALCAGAFNRDGSFLATASVDKSVHLWDCATGECVRKRIVTKKVTSLVIAAYSVEKSIVEAVLYGDKLGNAYALPMRDFGKEQYFLLGHTASILTGLKMTSNSQYLISMDRDEKIRISNFPKTYETHTYCLGHKSFVTSIVVPASLAGDSVLISAGGEGSICIWDYSTGMLVHTMTVPTSANDVSKEPDAGRNFASRIVYSETRHALAALAHSGDIIWLYVLQKQPGSGAYMLTLSQTISLAAGGFRDIAFANDECILAVPVAPQPLACFFAAAAASSGASDSAKATALQFQPVPSSSTAAASSSSTAAVAAVSTIGGIEAPKLLSSLALAWRKVTGKDASTAIEDFRRHKIQHSMHVDINAVHEKAKKAAKRRKM